MVSRETTALIDVRALSKGFGVVPVLQQVEMQVWEGEIVCLLGPSGSGKSTLLRCVAGLEVPDAGRVLLAGEDITARPAHERGFGMMFQQLALFPHRSVAQNVAFGLKMRGMRAAAQQARVDEMLALVDLAGYGARSIFELSGGEQQRVALARSLAPSPRLLMLDEPLAALDRGLRERLMDELRSILKRIGMTALYVTHDQQEAFAIADRMLLLHQGKKVQEGTPEEVYCRPANEFVAGFFGLHNRLAVHGVDSLGPGTWMVQTELGPLRCATDTPPTPLLLLRPDAARLATSDSLNVLPGIVLERSFRGSYYRLRTQHGGGLSFEWELVGPERELAGVGQPIRLSLRPEAITFLAP